MTMLLSNFCSYQSNEIYITHAVTVWSPVGILISLFEKKQQLGLDI